MDDSLIGDIRRHIEETTSEAALREWRELVKNPDPIYNYRLDHVVEVVNLARHLAIKAEADIEVVTIAAWLHDVAKPGFGDVTNHAEASAVMADEILRKKNVDTELIQRICDVVRKHVGLTLKKPLEPIEAQIVWEADKLTKIGLTGFIRFLFNTIRMKQDQLLEDMYNDMISFRSLWIGVVDSMTTPRAKEIARDRLVHLESIVTMMHRELNPER